MHQLASHEGGEPQQHQDTAQQGALGLDLALGLDEADLVPQVERECWTCDGQLQAQHGGQVMLAAEATVAGRQRQRQLGQGDGVAGQRTGGVDGLLLVVEMRVEQRLAEFVEDDSIALLYGTVGDVQHARALDGIGGDAGQHPQGLGVAAFDAQIQRRPLLAQRTQHAGEFVEVLR